MENCTHVNKVEGKGVINFSDRKYISLNFLDKKISLFNLLSSREINLFKY